MTLASEQWEEGRAVFLVNVLRAVGDRMKRVRRYTVNGLSANCKTTL